MDVQILDLDGSVATQRRLSELASRVVPLRGWGPSLRLACRWRDFCRFEAALARILGGTHDPLPTLRFLGSGDFHHLTLALLGRLREPCNLLVIDNHPDWMRGIPWLHCGTWLYHAAMLPQVRRVFHVGGDVDFDNRYRWLAPWPLLRSGKIVVMPAVRRFAGFGWSGIPQEPLRLHPNEPVTREGSHELLAPWREELSAWPLYVSVDRDVLQEEYAAVNWDTGRLVPEEVHQVIESFGQISGGTVGIDVVGDWSPVHVQGAIRRILHWVEHAHTRVDAVEAQTRNEQLNVALVEFLTTTPRPADSPALAQHADQHAQDPRV